MKHSFKKSITTKTSLFLLAIFTFASCVTQKNVEYLRDKNSDIKTFVDPAVDDYRLKPNDELYIKINSLDDETTNVFLQEAGQGGLNSMMTPYGASLLSYMVSSEGFLQLPVIGWVKVVDKTIPEVSTMLQDSLESILSNPTVTVKLVNRFVSVLGEVQRPGHYSYSKEKLTVFDAVGLAGDITEYGNRQEVILTRNENGENKRINIDLTSSQLLTSEYYYLRPNDMVYIKPMKKKFWGMRQFPFNILLSSITTALLIYQVAR